MPYLMSAGIGMSFRDLHQSHAYSVFHYVVDKRNTMEWNLNKSSYISMKYFLLHQFQLFLI